MAKKHLNWQQRTRNRRIGVATLRSMLFLLLSHSRRVLRLFNDAVKLNTRDNSV